MSRFAVVQERLEKIDHACLQPILQQYGGLMRADATRVARRAQGILWDRFEFDEAQKVVAALAQHDYPARVVAADLIPKLDKPRLITWLEIDDLALRVPWIADANWSKQQIQASDEATISVPWTSVFVISAGEVGQIVNVFAAQNGPYKMEDERMIEANVERECRLVSVTDLIGIGDRGQYLHIRLPANELAYGRILPPNRALDTTFKKYLAVLDQLVAHSVAAMVSPATRKLLVQRKQNPTIPRSASRAGIDAAAFENYNRWLMMLVIFKEQA